MAGIQRRFGSLRSPLTPGTVIDREEFFKVQSTAVNKALFVAEVPVKEKHLRVIILGSHQEKGCGTFWASVHRLNLESNRYLSWKFCHVLHKILRDGHENVLNDVLKYKTKIRDLGQLWVHLKNDVYGSLIKQYTRLLLCKMTFHQNNRHIPGNLALSDDQIASLGEQDVNNWFELAVEMLDYLDEIMELQALVFNSMDMSRANSLTPSGQCRLAPLILCILDSSCLYDYVVKMMFKLHAVLPPDVMVGHRDRFNKMFIQLKKFYYTSSNLQYFKYLVSIPTLPESPPNFLEASDFDSYIPTHAVALDQMSETGSDDTQSVATLVDLGGSNSPPATPMPQTQPQQQQQDDEKDQIITSLRHDLDEARIYVQRLQQECQNRIEQYENRLLQLEHELAASKDRADNLESEAERYREQADKLQNESNQQTIATAQLQQTQKQAQTNEERFNKMKSVYNKLREEHIETLQKLGELQKQLQGKFSSETDNQTKVTELEKTISTCRDELRASASKFEDKLAQLEKQRTAALDDLFGAACTAAVNVMQDTTEQFENPAHLTVMCGPEFLSSRLAPTQDALQRLSAMFTGNNTPTEPDKQMCSAVIDMTYKVSQLSLHAYATAHAAPAEHAEELAKLCNETTSEFTKLFGSFAIRSSWPSLSSTFSQCEQTLQKMSTIVDTLLGRMHGDVDGEQLGALIEKEMQQMDAAIRAAADRIQIIVNKSRETDTGVRLEVNNSILGACTALMQAVQELVRRARDLQNEIVAQGRGTGSVLEFYKRNHQWTEGLLSAAKAVGLGANVLVEAADRVISGQGKFEELMVASREIAASTAQLVVASKVKADRDSSCLAGVSKASKEVTTATANVIGNVKSGQQTLDETVNLDFSHLTMHQAKQMEFEAQVRVMELETQLARERQQLGELRKRHYQLAEAENGVVSNGN